MLVTVILTICFIVCAISIGYFGRLIWTKFFNRVPMEDEG